MDGTTEMDLEFWYESDSSTVLSDLPPIPSLKRRPGKSEFLQLPWDSSENVEDDIVSDAPIHGSPSFEGLSSPLTPPEQQPKSKDGKVAEETPTKSDGNVSETKAASLECSPSAPSSSGKKRRKKKKKPSSSGAVTSPTDGVAPSSRISSPELGVAPLVNGVSSPTDDGSGAFVDAVVSLPNGATGGIDRDSNVSPVSFHSLDSNDSALLANPDITFEFNATIPFSSSSSVVAPTAESAFVVEVITDNDVASSATSNAKKQAASSSNAKTGNPGGKKNKKSTPPTSSEVPAEMAVNAYTCHTPKVVLAAQNPDAEAKKIRRQTSTRVEEANVQFQVSLPAVNGEGDGLESKDGNDATTENNATIAATTTTVDVERDDEAVRTKDPWGRIYRRVDPVLVSQHGVSGGGNNVDTTGGSTNKKVKNRKSSESSSQQGQRRLDQTSVNADSKDAEEEEDATPPSTTNDVNNVSGKLVLAPANAQRQNVIQEQSEINATSLRQHQDTNDRPASPELDTLSTPLSAPSEDPSGTLTGSSTTLMGICEDAEDPEYPLIDEASGDDIEDGDTKVKEDDDDELNDRRTPSPMRGLMANGSSGGEDAASSSAAPLASPEDLTDISTSCGSSVQSACFETKEDLLANGAIPAQSVVIEETSMATDGPHVEDEDIALATPTAVDAEPVVIAASTAAQDPDMNSTVGGSLPTEVAPAAVAAAAVAPSPSGVPLVIPLHPDQQPMIMLEHAIVTYPVPPSFPIPPVPMHLPDGTDLDLTKPPPIPPNPAHIYGAAPYGGAYALPYPYTYPPIVPVDPNYPTSFFIQQQQPDGTMVMIPYHLAIPGVLPGQPLTPSQPAGGSVAPPNIASDAIASGAAAAATPPLPGSGVVSTAPLPPMPAAGVTPLAVVEGTSEPAPPTTEFQRSFSQEATESLKSLLNISSDNSPSNLQPQSTSGIPLDQGLYHPGFSMPPGQMSADSAFPANVVVSSESTDADQAKGHASKESSVTSTASSCKKRNRKRRPPDYYQRYNGDLAADQLASDFSTTDGDDVKTGRNFKPSKESLAGRSVSVGSNCSSSSGILGPSTTATSSGAEQTPSSSPEPVHLVSDASNAINDNNQHSSSALSTAAVGDPSPASPLTISPPPPAGLFARPTSSSSKVDDQTPVTVESPDSVINDPLPPFSLPTPPAFSAGEKESSPTRTAAMTPPSPTPPSPPPPPPPPTTPPRTKKDSTSGDEDITRRASSSSSSSSLTTTTVVAPPSRFVEDEAEETPKEDEIKDAGPSVTAATGTPSTSSQQQQQPQRQQHQEPQPAHGVAEAAPSPSSSSAVVTPSPPASSSTSFVSLTPSSISSSPSSVSASVIASPPSTTTTHERLVAAVQDSPPAAALPDPPIVGSVVSAISNHNNNIIAKKESVVIVAEPVVLVDDDESPAQEADSAAGNDDDAAILKESRPSSSSSQTFSVIESPRQDETASSVALSEPSVEGQETSFSLAVSTTTLSTVAEPAPSAPQTTPDGDGLPIAATTATETTGNWSGAETVSPPAIAANIPQPPKSDIQHHKSSVAEIAAAPPPPPPPVAQPALAKPVAAPPAAATPWGSKTFAQLFQGKERATPSPLSSPMSRPVASAPLASPASRLAAPTSTAPVTMSTSAAAPQLSISNNNCGRTPTESSVSSRASTPGISLDHLPVDERNKHLLAKLGESLKAFPLNHKPVALQPRGLINKSNWCYINATLQALLACPPFLNLVRSLTSILGSVKESSPTPILDSLVQFVSAFQQARAYSQVNKKNKLTEFNPGTAFEPVVIYNMLSLIKSNLSEKGRQQDAEEFLGCVLNGAHEEMETAIRVVSEPSAPSPGVNGGGGGDAQKMEIKSKSAIPNGDVKTPENEEDDGGWEVVPPKRAGTGALDPSRQAKLSPTAISEIFGGQLRMELKISGKSSKKPTANLQSFFTLPLDIQSDKVASVQDALERLSMKEHVEGYTDTKTKAEVEAWKFTLLEKLPPVLILHLKYFIYDSKGGLQKLSKKVDYPVDLEINKDILSHSIRTKVHNRYKLFAVVYHHGKSATGGHYTTDIYHIGVNGWIHMDDATVKKLPQGRDETFKHVPNRVPYLLYYRRCDLLQ